MGLWDLEGREGDAQGRSGKVAFPRVEVMEARPARGAAVRNERANELRSMAVDMVGNNINAVQLIVIEGSSRGDDGRE